MLLYLWEPLRWLTWFTRARRILDIIKLTDDPGSTRNGRFSIIDYILVGMRAESSRYPLHRFGNSITDLLQMFAIIIKTMKVTIESTSISKKTTIDTGRSCVYTHPHWDRENNVLKVQEIKVVQLNLNLRLCKNWLNRQYEEKVDVAIRSEQYKNMASATLVSDITNKAAIWSCGGKAFQEKPLLSQLP